MNGFLLTRDLLSIPTLSILPFFIIKSPIDLLWRKCCPDDCDFTFDRIFIKLADNKDRHKISDKFNFGPVLNIDIYPYT